MRKVSHGTLYTFISRRQNVIQAANWRTIDSSRKKDRDRRDYSLSYLLSSLLHPGGSVSLSLFRHVEQVINNLTKKFRSFNKLNLPRKTLKINLQLCETSGNLCLLVIVGKSLLSYSYQRKREREKKKQICLFLITSGHNNRQHKNNKNRIVRK